MLCVGYPAKVESGIGAIAVYMKILKNLPYTVRIMMKESTVINRLPISVIAQSGILSKNPQSSMALIISFGKVVFPVLVIPDDVMILLVTPLNYLEYCHH